MVNNTLNPEWKETHLLYVRDAQKDLLKVGLSRAHCGGLDD